MYFLNPGRSVDISQSLNTLQKAWIQLFSPRLWGNTRADSPIQTWYIIIRETGIVAYYN